MKTLCLLLAIVVCCASQLSAQLLAPSKVDLGYHFRAGQKLHYQRVDEIRNPDGEPGYQDGNYDVKEDIILTVDSVDAVGTSTITVHIDQSEDWKGGDNGLQQSFGGMAQDVPLYRVKLNRFGEYVDGVILRRDPKDSILHEQMKDPKFNGWSRPDSSRIKTSLGLILAPRPNKAEVPVGTKWHDSSADISHSFRLFVRNGSASTSERPAPERPSYKSHAFDYSIAGVPDRKEVFNLRVETSNGQVVDGQVISHWVSNGDEVIGKKDGMTTHREEISRTTANGLPAKAYMKRTLTLISDN